MVLAAGNNQNTEMFWKESWPKDYEIWQDGKFTEHWINDKKAYLMSRIYLITIIIAIIKSL